MPLKPVTYPLQPGSAGAEVVALQLALQTLHKAKSFGLTQEALLALESDLKDQSYRTATAAAVRLLQSELTLPRLIVGWPHGRVDSRTASIINQRLAALGLLDLADTNGSLPGTSVSSAPITLQGVVLQPNRRPAADIDLEVVVLGIGGKVIELSAAQQELLTTSTDEAGAYFVLIPVELALPTAGKTLKPATLQIRRRKSATETVALSQPLTGLRGRVTINLVSDSLTVSASSEFERLTEALLKHAGLTALSELAAAKERPDQRDISTLATQAGWDARLVALAAHAQQLVPHLGALPADSRSEVAYALLRSGLPTNKEDLAEVPPAVAAAAVAKARDAGVVRQGLSLDEAAFRRFRATVRLSRRMPGDKTAVTDWIVGDAPAKRAFATFLEQYESLDSAGKPVDLWTAARTAPGLNAASVQAVQDSFRLADVLGYSRGLIEQLASRRAFKPNSPEDLTDAGYHDPQAWLGAGGPLHDLNDPDVIDGVLPPVYAGDSARQRLEAYVEDVCRELRVRMPTRVIAQQLRAPLPGQGLPLQHADKVAAFLVGPAAGGSDQPFTFSRVGMGTYLQRGGLQQLQAQVPDAAQRATVVAELKRLHRAYQLAPRNAALRPLLASGLDSAARISSLSPGLARQKLQDAGMPAEDARRVVDRAHQIQAITTTTLTSLRTHATAPAMTVLRASDANPAARGWLDPLAGTELAQIMAAADHCACEHCESVLSPSAYLVDLLRMLDTPCDKTDDPKNPRAYAALMARRPDLAHIPLTCDNSHTPLPYIDLVNEILEFAVEHGGQLSNVPSALPSDNRGRSSEDLLVEPVHLRIEAYRKLAEARLWPQALPFDLPVEMAREWSRQLGRPLAEWLDAARNAKQQASATGTLGRGAVDLEWAGLAPAELPAFTQANPALWHEYYGFGSAADVKHGLQNLKQLSQRLGVTYEELHELLGTWFVNPVLGQEHLLRRARLGPLEARYWGTPANQQFYKQYENVAGGPRALWTPDQHNKWATLVRNGEVDRLNVLQGLNWRARELSENGRRALMERAQSNAWNDALVVSVAVDRTPAAADPCDMTQIRLARVTAQGAAEPVPMDWVRLSLFVRWWRRLGCSIPEADTAFQALMPGVDLRTEDMSATQSLNRLLPHFALRMGVARQVHALLTDVTFEQTLTLWSDITTAGARSQYARMFLSPELLALDPVFESETGAYLPSVPVLPMKEHLDALGKVLYITKADFDAFIGHAGHRDNLPLSLASVSLFMRYAVLARGMGMSIGALGESITLTGLNCFARPEAPNKLPPDHDTALRGTVHLFNAHALMGNARLTWTDAASWQKGELSAAEAWDALRWMGILADPTGLATALASEFDIAPETAMTLVTDAAVLSTAPELAGKAVSVAEVLAAAVANPAFKVSYRSSAPGVEPVVVDVTRSTIPAWTRKDIERVRAELQCSFTSPVNADMLLLVLPADRSATAEVKLNGQAVLRDPSGRGFKCKLAKGQLVQLVVSAPAAAQPLDVAIELPGRLGNLGLELLSVNPPDLLAGVRAMAMVRRAAELVSRLELPAIALRYFATVENPEFQVRLAPLVTPSAKTAQVSGLTQLLRYVAIRKSLRTSDEALVALLRGVDTAGQTRSRSQLLAGLLARDLAWVETALQCHGLGLDGSTLTNLENLERLISLITLCDGMKVQPNDLTAWRDVVDFRKNFDARQKCSLDMVEHARSLEPVRSWRRTAKPSFDRLRQRRRDALVSYLLQLRAQARPKEPLPTPEQLYEHLLIDPKMEPVVQSSRIRLAIASVQLFIQRVLLGLESIPAASIDSELWEWMRRYRVWEANRKIFLYPENWLEPEFRNEKTHLFEELEGALLQGDFTQERAEQALLAYLQGLQQVGRVEILSTYWQEDADAGLDVLHVVGRSAGKYFYRQRRGSHWKPWIPVTANVEGKHVAPVVWRGGVFLVWMVFRPEVKSTFGGSEAAKSQGATDQSISQLQTQAQGTQHVRLQLQLNWCELSAGTWGETRFGPLRYWATREDRVARAAIDDTKSEGYEGSGSRPVEEDEAEGTSTGEATNSSTGEGVADDGICSFPKDFTVDSISMRATEDQGMLVVLLQTDDRVSRALAITVPGRLAEPRTHQQPYVKPVRPFPPPPSARPDAGRVQLQDGAVTMEFVRARHVNVKSSEAQVPASQLKAESFPLLTPAARIKYVTLAANRRMHRAVLIPRRTLLTAEELAVDAKEELHDLESPLFYQDRENTLFAQPLGGRSQWGTDKGGAHPPVPSSPTRREPLFVQAQPGGESGYRQRSTVIGIHPSALYRLDDSAGDWLVHTERPVSYDQESKVGLHSVGGPA